MKLVRAYLINTAALGAIEARLMDTSHTADQYLLENIKKELTARVASTEGKLIEEIERDDD